jgi:PAS domain S-box-containing protein
VGPSIRAHLLTGYLGALTLLVVAWAVATMGAASLRANYAYTVTATDTLSNIVLQSSKLRDDEETGLRGYVLTGKREFLQPYTSAQSELPGLQRRADALVATAPDIRPSLLAQGRLSSAWDRWARGVLRDPTAYPRGAAALIAQQRAGKLLFDRYRAATDRIIRLLDQDRRQSFHDGMAALTHITLAFVALFAGAVGLLTLLGWRTMRAVVGPLQALGYAATAIGQGDLTRPVVITGPREFARLGRDMDGMRRRLDAREAALRASEERVRTVVTGAPLILFALDAAGVFTLSEGKALGTLGQTPGQVVGRSIFETSQDYPDVLDYIRRTLAGETVTYISRVGGGTWDNTLTPIRDEAGRITGLIGVTTDITERARAEEALRASKEDLERSNTELAQFAYIASHDLQEPLRTITSYLQLLKRRYRGRLDESADDFIDYAVDGATRMSRLIQDVLAYSRVGTRPKEFILTDSDTLVRAAVSDLRARIEETGARVVHDGLPTVWGDDAQLGQLFQNLIGNALKFRRPDAAPHVMISAERQGDAWTIRVRDNGIGIAPEQAERIFQIFQRLHTREEYEGTGIGLAVCKKIVERHGGRIWVESTPGQGTTFLFTVPALPDAARRAT